jgi:predicted Zn-dependent protease
MQILAKTGFDPYSMPTFFERLLTATRYFDNGIPEFLRTHPITTDRIAEARERAEQYAKKLPEDTIAYHLMRAKLVVLTQEKSKDLVNELREMLQAGRYRDERATRYALALAALEHRQVQEATTQIDWLLKRDSDRLVYRLLQAHLALLQEKPTQAFMLYEQALQIYPDNLLLILTYAEKLLQYHKAERAETILSTLSTSSNPDYYRLLAKTYQLTHKPAEAQLALAEHYYLMGQTGLAVEQLKQAREQKAHLDFYTAARIEARYKVLQEAWYEEQIAERQE